MGTVGVMEWIVAIEGVVILLLLLLVAGLLKSHAEILRELHRLGGGRPSSEGSGRAVTTGFELAPRNEVVGVDVAGAPRTVSLTQGRETLLAFLSTGCASCRVFWDAFAAEPELPTPSTRPVIVTKGATAESPAKVAALAPAGVPVIMSDDAWDAFKVPLTPFFMLVDGAGRVIGEGSATTWDHLIGLLRQSAADAQVPTHMDTVERERFTDSRLHMSGIDPGDPSLYENPLSR